MSKCFYSVWALELMLGLRSLEECGAAIRFVLPCFFEVFYRVR